MKWIRLLITSVAVALALGALCFLYYRFIHYPWTRDAQVRANVVGIASRVAGPIVRIPLIDNQYVRKGDLLFEVDPSTYQADLAKAEATVQQAQANVIRTQQQLQRESLLYEKKVTDLRDLQDAEDDSAAAQASLQAARASLESAHLNLRFTRIVSPIDGYLTNFNTSPGTYVTAGQQLLALVDSNSFWVAAYFTEAQLPHIHPGDSVRIKLMSRPQKVFYGKVESVGWAIYRSDGAPVNLLPQVRETIEWVRLPQRFPIRIVFDPLPSIPLRLGETASVSIISNRR